MTILAFLKIIHLPLLIDPFKISTLKGQMELISDWHTSLVISKLLFSMPELLLFSSGSFWINFVIIVCYCVHTWVANIFRILWLLKKTQPLINMFDWYLTSSNLLWTFVSRRIGSHILKKMWNKIKSPSFLQIIVKTILGMGKKAQTKFTTISFFFHILLLVLLP